MVANKPIGGFFELELPKGTGAYHPEAIPLTNGRACLSLILTTQKVNKVYVPFFCCDALFEPLISLSIDFEFYFIDKRFEICTDLDVGENDLVIYVNYFGIKNKYCSSLVSKYGSRIVIDNTHAFFSKKYDGVFSFTSARKYFGVPDGAYLYMEKTEVEGGFQLQNNTSVSLEHNVLRLIGEQELAYKKYLSAEKLFSSEILKISKLSEKILSSIDYMEVMKIRERNFLYLHKKLNGFNNVDFDGEISLFCYPLLLDRKVELKFLHEKDIFIPVLWEDVNSRLKGVAQPREEAKLVSNMLALPIDQRVSIEDMDRMIKALEEILIHE
ncbi:hypothetical protein [Shewanella halifaxensis]|uniref:hypothetical protein n=1 Tax=Shewanella halifaxensis TaxID=271098 RepID=UPI000D5901FC|nr:hypothetical protein [Shewanella halifaxensis]